MRGRQVFMDSLVAHDANAIFGNPGTTENPVLDSLSDYPSIQYYVALHEGVAVCAAAFYALASGRTAVANIHVAPGLGNAIGMMYGALKACAPVVVTAGQQDTRMRLRDPILAHDLTAMAAPVSKWTAEPRNAEEIAPLMRRAFKIANDAPAGPVFLALPVDVLEQETDIAAATSGALYAEIPPAADGIEQLSELVLSSSNPAIIAGDDIAAQGANAALAQLAAISGASVYVEFLRAQLSIAMTHANFCGRIPIENARIRELLAPHDLVLMIGGPFFEEVWFDPVNCFSEDTRVAQIETSPSRLAHNFSLSVGIVGHLSTSLDALVNAITARQNDTYVAAAAERNTRLKTRKGEKSAALAARLEEFRAARPMPAFVALHEIAQALPSNAIVMDEGITASFEAPDEFPLEARGDYYAGRGGGIGQGIAGALGIAVAQPKRPVVAISGDGSAMYSIQALWTATHHALNIVFVIASNREYRVLKHNLDIYRQRFDVRADRPYPHMDLSVPILGFVDMAKGMGVPARQIDHVDDLGPAVRAALATPGPYLLDVTIAGKS